MDKVLDTVVNNLIVTSNLNVEANCRVLLTTPLETLTIGHTIVISSGLVDVLPDEASLAMVLSDELAHIALGHRTNTQFAFHNQTMFPDDELLQRFRFVRTPEEIASAERKAIEILRKSPYKDKMANAGLFLRALASRAPEFPNLIRANIGNRLASGDAVVRMGELVLAGAAARGRQTGADCGASAGVAREARSLDEHDHDDQDQAGLAAFGAGEDVLRDRPVRALPDAEAGCRVGRYAVSDAVSQREGLTRPGGCIMFRKETMMHPIH